MQSIVVYVRIRVNLRRKAFTVKENMTGFSCKVIKKARRAGRSLFQGVIIS